MTDLAQPFARTRSEWSRSRDYIKLAAAYLLVYLALNTLTDHRSLGGTAITLWSPDDALSVLLIMESWTFAPILWLAQIVVDLLFNHLGRSFYADVCAQTVLAAGLCGLAYTLRVRFGVNVRALRPRDLFALSSVVPIGVALVGLCYCGALIVLGQLAPADALSTFAGFWIGDAAAMCILIPAAGALFRVIVAEPWRKSEAGNALFVSAVTLAFAALVVFVSTASVESRYVFNLLYLPILLIGMKYGFDAGAMALLLVQLLLLAALDYFKVGDREFAAYQVLMFILAISGQALGGTFTEWETATAELRRQQADLAKVSERATNAAMAAAMSHEISQPLASIAAYLFGARRLLETGQSADRALAALRKAEGEAARARGIIERLRDFVAKGATPMDLLDLNELVEIILRLQADAARERGVALYRPPGEVRPLMVRADRIGIEQAIANLVLNAIEAAPAKNGEVVLSLTSRDGKAAVEVDDNGQGVAPEIAERLFEPFETTKPRGMGLGLPLAKEIALRHGGALTWRPLAPHGTRFALELPLA
jgi:two-component system sensor kinase FixL